VSDFILGNRRTALRSDEILTAILIPRRHEAAASSFFKLGARRYLVISIVMVAAVVAIDDGMIADARIAVGACSAVAKRLPELEADLRAKPASAIGDIVDARHLSALSPIDDVRASASYRHDAARIAVRRALQACVADGAR
jgi:CO/xanthine dehydrogenase FAD-binding subunit